MKACRSCILEYGRAICTHLGCCVFEDIHGKPPKDGESRLLLTPPLTKEGEMAVMKSGEGR